LENDLDTLILGGNFKLPPKIFIKFIITLGLYNVGGNLKLTPKIGYLNYVLLIAF